jgi:hypothetical protein
MTRKGTIASLTAYERFETPPLSGAKRRGAMIAYGDGLAPAFALCDSLRRTLKAMREIMLSSWFLCFDGLLRIDIRIFW